MADPAEVVSEEEVVVEQPETDKDFDEGFTDTPTEPTPPVVEEPVVVEKTVEAPAAPKYVQVTEEQLKGFLELATKVDQAAAASKKALDTANGKYGDLERRLQTLQSATPAGVAVEVTDDVVADIAEEFPELAGKTLSALKKFAGKMKGTAPAAPFDAGQVAPLITASQQQLSREILSMKHEDWEEVVGLPDKDGKPPETEYRKWLATQPKEYQEEISGSWNARAISKSIDKFKSHAKVAADAAAEAAKKVAAKPAAKPAQPSARQARLAAAVTPRGDGAHAPAAAGEDEFDAGFKSG